MKRIAEYRSGKTRLALLAVSAFILLFTSIAFVIGTETEDVVGGQKTGSAVGRNCRIDSCNSKSENAHKLNGNRIRTALHNQFSSVNNQ